MSKQTLIPACEYCQSRVTSIFSNLKAQEIHSLSENKCGNIYKKGQAIYYEGNKPNGIFCVNKGVIKIFKMNEDGKEQILRLAKAGDVVGFSSLLNGEFYSTTATVVEDALICHIPKNVFMHLLENNSEFSLRLIQFLSHELKRSQDNIAYMAQHSVRERLAETLLAIKEFGGCEPDGITLNVALSREELANMVGTATETLIRLLSEFNHERIVELTGRKIKLLNSQELIRIANVSD